MEKLFLSLVLVGSILMAGCEEPEGAILRTSGAATEIAPAAHPVKHNYSLHADKSTVEWRGAGPGAAHHGSFAVSGQDIEVVNGKLKRGTFIIPIASIQNFDLPAEVKPVLLDHLKSTDFFNMVLYPEAAFAIKHVVPLTKPVDPTVTGANVTVTGDFTMLGKTNKISFPAKVVLEGDNMSVEALLQLDRTKWGMTYAADPALGDHHIYPQVDLHLTLFGFRQ